MPSSRLTIKYPRGSSFKIVSYRIYCRNTDSIQKTTSYQEEVDNTMSEKNINQASTKTRIVHTTRTGPQNLRTVLGLVNVVMARSCGSSTMGGKNRQKRGNLRVGRYDCSEITTKCCFR